MLGNQHASFQVTSGAETELTIRDDLMPFRFYPEIYTASVWNEAVKKYGDWFTYDKSPRSQIFRRDHGKVHDIDSMFKLMRLVNV